MAEAKLAGQVDEGGTDRVSLGLGDDKYPARMST
jgi:hypothetical protein